MAARYLPWIVSESSDELVAEVEKRLDVAALTLSRLDALDRRQSARLGARIDRLASALSELSPSPADAVPSSP